MQKRKKFYDIRGQIRELDSKWGSAKEELSQVTQEHEEYKAKARKVLLEKEKLISSFNETGSASGSSAGHFLDPGTNVMKLFLFINFRVFDRLRWKAYYKNS